MSAAQALGLPPGVRFDPSGDELVEFYLLPRALGREPAVPGIIIEDDDTTSTTTSSASAQHPWKLLKRHRRTDDDEAYFFERVDATKSGDGARHQDRSCGGSWTWVGQKRAPDEVLPVRGNGGDGEKQVSWGKYSLNLQEGRRKGGSTGWVMHEYTVASPECPLLPVKLCHVSFTGHGQKRQRVPDGDGEGEGEGRELQVDPQAAATVPPPHKRAATGSSMVTTATATAMPNQELSEACCAHNQELLFPNYNYNSSSIGDFWSSDAGFSQESSIVQDPSSYRGEPFALDQQLAQNQEFAATQSQAYHQEQQFVNTAGSSIQAHCAELLASDLAIEEEFSVSQLLGLISSPLCPPTSTTPPAAYHEQQQQQNTQSFAPAATADLPLSTDHESCMTEESHGIMGQYDGFFSGWGDIESFCDTTGIPDDDAMADPQMLAADGCRGGTSWDGHFFYEQPAL